MDNEKENTMSQEETDNESEYTMTPEDIVDLHRSSNYFAGMEADRGAEEATRNYYLVGAIITLVEAEINSCTDYDMEERLKNLKALAQTVRTKAEYCEDLFYEIKRATDDTEKEIRELCSKLYGTPATETEDFDDTNNVID